jgi:sugar phosphate isomerase/epimerase
VGFEFRISCFGFGCGYAALCHCGEGYKEMAISQKHTIGVSPAYFISRFGNRFTPEEVAAGLKELAQIGFQGFQLEVFHRETLQDWIHSGSSLVCRASGDLGLKATQFVAHFMLEAFANREKLFSDAGIAEMESVLEIVGRHDECRIVTVPLGAFEAPRIPGIQDYRNFFDRCVEKIGALLAMVEEAGRRMALEILPSAIIGGIDGFVRICEHLHTVTLGLNFDTGHAWASKEHLYMVPAKLGRRILGTHLCDNFGNENFSLRPGAGSIDWPRLVETLRSSGYDGAFDIEIICRPDETRDEYSKARAYVATLLSN